MSKQISSLLKRYHQEGFGFKTLISGAVSGLMFAFASNPQTIATLFGGQWPQYIPTPPFQIFSTIAGLGMAYETFHLYRKAKKII